MDIRKYEFNIKKTKFLSLIIEVNKIRINLAKVVTIVEWKTPEYLTNVQSFIGFYNFYKRFIKGFFRIIKPFTRLIRKNEAFKWNKIYKAAFKEIKQVVTKAPVLAHFDRDKKAIVKTDSSDYVSSGILSQIGEDGLLHPVAFLLKKLITAECNYNIYDKELLAIIRCFEEWKPELEGTGMPVKVLFNYKNLEYFITTKKLTRRQARWAEFLINFNFKISYRPGKKNEKADSLTKRTGDLLKDENDNRQRQQHQIMLPREKIHPDVRRDLDIASIKKEENEGIRERIVRGQAVNDFCQKIKKILNSGV